MEEKRKNIILITVVGIATLFVAVIGLTFAYFQAQSDRLVTRSVRITTETADSTSYSIDKTLSLNINQTNFGFGQGDVSGDEVTAIALFTATTSGASELCYTLKISVPLDGNDFEYTSNYNAIPTHHYVASVGDDSSTYYDDIDTNNATEAALIAYLIEEGYASTTNNVTSIKTNPDSSTMVTLTEFYGSSLSKTNVFVANGYLVDYDAYPKSADPELVLNVTRQTVSNVETQLDVDFTGTETPLITNLDITTLTGDIYVPISLTNTSVVTPSNKGELGTIAYYDDENGAKNIQKITATAGKTSAHKYIVWATAKNKNYDQQEITNKHFAGTLSFTTVSCNTPTP